MQVAEFENDEDLLLGGSPSAAATKVSSSATKRERSSVNTEAAPETPIRREPAQPISTSSNGGAARSGGAFSFQGGNGISKMSALAFGKPAPSAILNTNGDESQRKTKQPRVCTDSILASAKKNAELAGSPKAALGGSLSCTPTSTVKASPTTNNSSVAPTPSISATPAYAGATVAGIAGGAMGPLTPEPQSTGASHPAQSVARSVLFDDEQDVPATPINNSTAAVAASPSPTPAAVAATAKSPAAPSKPTTTMLKKSGSLSSSPSGPKQQTLAAFFKPKQ